MADLDSVLDALAGDDLPALGAAGLLERTAQLVAARNRLDAELARTVRIAETTQAPEHDGLRSTASWLRGHARLSARAAGLLVGNGRALAHLPAVAAGCAAGLITADQLAVIAPITSPANLAAAADAGVDLTEIDRILTDVATSARHDTLAQVVHVYLARLDPDGPEPDPTQARSLSIATHPDGSITGRFDLDEVGGEKVRTGLEALLQAHRPAGDTRTRAQQLADALVQLADNALATGRLPVLRSHKPQVVVTIPIADLIDPATGHGAAQLGFGAAISAARARMLACDGTVTRIVIGPDSQPMNLGRSHRVVPPQLRRAVEIRDQTCVFTGCGAPHHWCDVHHLLHWAHDGQTSLDNSGLLCERHHTQVHHGFTIHRDPHGRWHTYRPDGTEIRTPTPLRS
jgi:Domain of unknown function (DUF222)